jgi:lysozyme family protein
MADFNPAFEAMLRDEGGYQLTDIAGDHGGQTYAGIARKPNPDWIGWALVDRREFGASLTTMVRDFYRARFWTTIRGDEINEQAIAESIFNFAVNTGVGPAVKIAQVIAGATPDGAIGAKTIELLNQCTAKGFVASYALAKIRRYSDICNRDRGQSKFLLGWVNRSLSGLKQWT